MANAKMATAYGAMRHGRRKMSQGGQVEPKKEQPLFSKEDASGIAQAIMAKRMSHGGMVDPAEAEMKEMDLGEDDFLSFDEAEQAPLDMDEPEETPDAAAVRKMRIAGAFAKSRAKA